MALPSYFYCYPKPGYGVLICKIHQHAILPDSVARHLSDSHTSDISATHREAIASQAKQIANEYHTTYGNIQVPTQVVPAIRGLTLWRGSLQCRQCSYICTGSSAEANIKQHLRSAHQVWAPQTGFTRAERASWWSNQWTEITTQQFFRRIPGKEPTHGLNHFEVLVEELSSGSASPSTPTRQPVVLSSTPTHEGHGVPSNLDPNTQAELDQLFSDYAAAKASRQIQRKADAAQVPAVPKRQTNPYLEHTKFQECVAGLTWEEARRYISADTDCKAQHLINMVKSTTLVYQHVVAMTSRWARIRVMQESSSHVPKSPLFPYQMYSQRHPGVLWKIILFFYHVYEKSYTRPPTLPPFTKAQDEAWKAIASYLDELPPIPPTISTSHHRSFLEPFERLCHSFWLSLIEQTATRNDFELALITPLAFIAVDSNQDGFRPAYLFATDLSAVKKLMRFAACQRLWDRGDSPPSPTLANVNLCDENLALDPDVNLDEATAILCEQEILDTRALDALDEDRARDENDQFRQWVYRYLSERYHTPMAWIISSAQYIGTIQYGETIDAFVRWNGSTVTVKEVSTTFEKFQSMVWSLQRKAQDDLCELAFTDQLPKMPSIPWDKIDCDPSRQETGYSPFTKMEEHGYCPRDFVLHQMGKAIRTRTFTKSTFRLDDYYRIQRYSAKVREFLTTLFLLVYLTSGQPPRFTELLSAQVENTVNDGLRNFFMYEGLVAVVLRYHKGYNQDKSPKIIFRYLPIEVGQLFVWYCSLIRPFWQVITERADEAERTSHYYQARSAFLWPDSSGEQISDTRSYSAAMRDETLRYMEVIIKPQLMRHLIIAFGRKLDQGRGKRVGSNLQILDPEELEEALNEEHDQYREMQAGHTPNTAIGVYASEMAAMFRMRFQAAEAHLKVSTRWHMDLGFQRTPSPSIYPENRLSSVVTRVTDRMKRRAHVNLAAILRGNFGSKAKFRGQQKEVVEAILSCNPAVAYIAGTGSGKSLAFLLPACCEDFGQTVLITPLVALREDILANCRQLCVTCSAWGDASFNSTARIILAMPEHLDQPRFLSLIRSLYDLGQLERIVVDEFHCVLLHDNEYRPSLLQISEVARHGVPLTLLSATIPYHREQEAFYQFGIHGNVTVFRQSTSRPNLAYEVVTLPDNMRADSEAMVQYIRNWGTLLNKLLIYVPFRGIADWLAEQLDCLKYHGKMSEQARREAQHAFATCKQGTLIATTAFNAGVHIPDIRGVIRLGEPDDPISWIQEAGRGGRDGERCVVRIVLGEQLQSFFNKLPASEKKVLDQIMLRNKRDNTCMRVTIDNYFDGPTTRLSCAKEEQACQFCVDQRSMGVLLSPTPVDKVGLSSPATTRIPNTPTQLQNILPMTSPTPYKLSSPPTWQPRTLAGQETTPIQQSGQSSFAMSMSTTGSPAKRHRHQVSEISISSPSTEPGSSASAKVARIERTLEYMSNNAMKTQRDVLLLKDQLIQTAEYWLDHCVACFVAHRQFDHPRDSSGCDYTSGLVNMFRRQKMRPTGLGRGLCYHCFFPPSLCQRWLNSDGSIGSHPGRNMDCTYPHVVPDVWATLWAACPTSRQRWIDRIVSSQPDFDPHKPIDFSKYFSNGELFPKPLAKVSHITLDVNWITQQYFLSEERRWEALLSDEDKTTTEALAIMASG